MEFVGGVDLDAIVASQADLRSGHTGSDRVWQASRATARDLFDLSLVIEREPEKLATAAPFLVHHREAFLQQIRQRRAVLGAQFEAIDALDYQPGYDEAVERASQFLHGLRAAE